MEKSCLVCGNAVKGRLDKIFCSNHCKSFYHNHKNRDNLVLIQKINKILRKNRQILESALEADFVEVEVTALTQMGFTPNYHTQIRRLPQGNIYFFVYDLGFELVDNGKKMKLLRINQINFPK